MGRRVYLERCAEYSRESLDQALQALEPLFAGNISPGDRVVIKPNWVAQHHKYATDSWVPVITHPALISAVIRRAILHLKGSGRITVADSPQHDSSFEQILERMPVLEWAEECRRAGVGLQVLDLRDEVWELRGEVIVGRKALPGDPAGSLVFRLEHAVSAFNDHRPGPGGYYGAMFDRLETQRDHADGWHSYRVSKTVIDCDVFINLPKLKSHRKAGLTCSLKNAVGIATKKNCLPHHTEGTPSQGGDQFPDNAMKHCLESHVGRAANRLMARHESLQVCMVPAKRLWKAVFGKSTTTSRGGSWYGNDTIWRTVLDLNKILLYGDPTGTLRESVSGSRKKYVSIVDAVVAGEGDGPLSPDSVQAGLILGGDDPVSVDCLAARVMGFDHRKVPTVSRALSMRSFPLADCSYDQIEVRSKSIPAAVGGLENIPEEHCLRFRPHFGWAGRIERPFSPK